MSRSDLMARLLRLARLAESSRSTGQDADEAIGRNDLGNQGRRNFAKGALAGTAVAATWSLAPGAFAAPPTMGRGPIIRNPSGSVAIVGAGLAGLSCATELARLGINARVYEAADRVGGRCASLRGFFPGQVVERGGEFFSGAHHTMVGYARDLGLELEHSSQLTGGAFYHYGGQRYSEAQVVEEYRQFADSIREDLNTLSRPSADSFSVNDEAFDYMSLADYLDLHGAGRLLRGVIGSAYLAEYGASIDELSSITFLRFVHGDKRSKQAPFGVHGGQMLRVADGNDRIATGLAARLPSPVQLGRRLVSVRRLSGGQLRLVFDVAGKSVHSDHHAVVMTLPFSVLREVELHPSLKLPAWKTQAINSAAMGDHSKLLLGFRQPAWRGQGLNGTGFSDLSFMQSTWEANPSRASATAAVLAGYVGGSQGRGMTSATLQSDASALLANLEGIVPGATAAATRGAGGVLQAYTENWTANPLSRGSHSCNRPGYFTTTAHHEAKPVENLLFAGEHTSSFYEWQGFMEGAALSGLRAAGEVLALARA